jgi:osmotically inducible lipoprotein OsmB
MSDQGKSIVKTLTTTAAMALALMGLTQSGPAEARHYRHYRSGHGNCLRFNKTTGSVAGAVGGGLLGHAIIGGTGGLLVGAAAGGLAGHELAHNRRKRC